MTQRVVVIGATGQIGRPLRRDLLRSGHSVVVFSRDPFAFALQQPDLDGPVNRTAPEPVRAREFAQALGQAVSRRAWLPVPAPLARMSLGVITDILVHGKRVIPARLSALGYQFSFPILDAALQELLGQPGSAAAAAR